MRALPVLSKLSGALLVIAVCAWCGWASAYRLSTWQAWVTWLASLLIVMGAWVALRRGRQGLRFGWLIHAVPSWPSDPHAPRARTLQGLSPWILLCVLILAWEILGIDTGRHTPHLTISALSQDFRPVHAAMLAVWIATGVAYGVARASLSPTSAGPICDSVVALLPVVGLARLSAIAMSHRPGFLDLLSYRAVLLSLLLGRSRAVGVAFWIGVLVCATAVDLAARGSAARIPSFLQLLQLVSRPAVARFALVVTWTFAGWHLFAH